MGPRVAVAAGVLVAVWAVVRVAAAVQSSTCSCCATQATPSVSVNNRSSGVANHLIAHFRCTPSVVALACRVVVRAGCHGSGDGSRRTRARVPSARARGGECRPGQTNSPPQARPEPLLKPKTNSGRRRSVQRPLSAFRCCGPGNSGTSPPPLTRSVRAHRFYALHGICQCSHDGELSVRSFWRREGRNLPTGEARNQRTSFPTPPRTPAGGP